ncbi:hypothetical protein NQD34_016727 [Periophthalmus magnuspinnatus]|nr:hypothetical protein NQD34_016727 [Periophthalmus magnuspinnatus]
MAKPSSSSLAFPCPGCHMWSDDPGLFDDDRDSCVKCSVVAVLQARVSELETRIRSLEALTPSYSQVAAVGTADRSSFSVTSETSPPAQPVQPGSDQDRFVTVRRKRRTGQGHRAENRTVADQGHRVESRELPVQNRFAPLSWTRDTLVIGSSIVRDVELPAASTCGVTLEPDWVTSRGILGF